MLPTLEDPMGRRFSFSPTDGGFIAEQSGGQPIVKQINAIAAGICKPNEPTEEDELRWAETAAAVAADKLQLAVVAPEVETADVESAQSEATDEVTAILETT